MPAYPMRHLAQVRQATGTSRSQLMLQIFRAVTDDYETARTIAVKSRTYVDQVCKILAILSHLDYLDRKRVIVKYSQGQGKVYAYRRNGRNLVTEEYEEWKEGVNKVTEKLDRIKQLKFSKWSKHHGP